jgi:DNA-binding transcriptional LysR family regulator
VRTSIRVIEIFIRVVDTGSFVAAARSLLIDPAAVSRAVKGLEESLGMLLFTRSTRVLKLTAAGKRFYRDGGQMLRSFDDTLHRFQADTAVQRQLKVGMGPALGRRMMLRAIPSFQDRHPQVRLILLNINDPAEIGDEGIDVLIRPRSTRRHGAEHKQPQGLVVRKLLQSPIMVCASPDYLKRQGIPRAPADLARHACLALLTLERDVQDEWKFARSGAQEKIKFTPTLTANGEELREAALAGCGIVRLLACHVEDEIRSGALVRVLPAWECLGGLPIVAIYRKTKPSLSPVNAFVDHLAQAFRRYNDYVAVRG